MMTMTATKLGHIADSWWLALVDFDFDFDDNVPDVLSKLIYKWSSYIRMSMYSWAK